jgi:hypothetical protein
VRRVKLARISASLSNAPSHASGELMRSRLPDQDRGRRPVPPHAGRLSRKPARKSGRTFTLQGSGACTLSRQHTSGTDTMVRQRGGRHAEDSGKRTRRRCTSCTPTS